MVTKRLSEMAKARRAFRRAFAQLGQSLPALARNNWRNVLMPWRLLPQPIALALIGLVALAMVLNPPEADSFDVATIGGTAVPSTLACEEDEVIGFVGIPDTLVCIQFEQTVNGDAHGCVPPAFYSEALAVCVLGVSEVSSTAVSSTATATAPLVATSLPTTGIASP